MPQGQSPLPYQLIRSRRRTLCIEVQPPGVVLVRAPLRASQQDIERFLMQKRDWLVKHLNKAQRLPKEYDAQEVANLRAQAKEAIPALVSRLAPLVGAWPRKITINSAKKRFGSCSAKGNLCFSFRLMAYPQAAIEYVVVHELTHLIHLNHSPAFYQAIARVMPDYKQRQALLKSGPLPRT